MNLVDMLLVTRLHTLLASFCNALYQENISQINKLMKHPTKGTSSSCVMVIMLSISSQTFKTRPFAFQYTSDDIKCPLSTLIAVVRDFHWCIHICTLLVVSITSKYLGVKT